MTISPEARLQTSGTLKIATAASAQAERVYCEQGRDAKVDRRRASPGAVFAHDGSGHTLRLPMRSDRRATLAEFSKCNGSCEPHRVAALIAPHRWFNDACVPDGVKVCLSPH
jgi:hypothetical protein